MTEMNLNYLWLKPWARQEDDKQEGWMPRNYVRNLKIQAENNMHLGAKVNFWHNPGHLTPLGRTLLTEIGELGLNVRDLNEIPEYSNSQFFTTYYPDGDDEYGFTQYGLSSKRRIHWRQIDAAKVLILKHTLPERNGQTFFSDLDIKQLQLTSYKIQRPILEFGLVVGVEAGDFENQFMGFSSHMKNLLITLFAKTMEYAVQNPPKNGFSALLDLLSEGDAYSLHNIGYKTQYTH